MSFKKYLEDIEYPTENNNWNISGIIKNRTNQKLTFDTRPLLKTKEGELGKYASLNTQADKMVFEEKDSFIIVDVKELISYCKDNGIKKVYLQDLISKLDWNIILPKN
jgi:hypothetical protein